MSIRSPVGAPPRHVLDHHLHMPRQPGTGAALGVYAWCRPGEPARHALGTLGGPLLTRYALERLLYRLAVVAE